MSVLREVWAMSEATRGESRPGNAKDKQVVFYCGRYSVGWEGFHGSDRKTPQEKRFESLSEMFEWLTDRIAAGDSYYIDVRSE